MAEMRFLSLLVIAACLSAGCALQSGTADEPEPVVSTAQAVTVGTARPQVAPVPVQPAVGAWVAGASNPDPAPWVPSAVHTPPSSGAGGSTPSPPPWVAGASNPDPAPWVPGASNPSPAPWFAGANPKQGATDGTRCSPSGCHDTQAAPTAQGQTATSSP